jgi:plastocyanin
MSRVIIAILAVLLVIAGGAALTLSFFLLSARRALDEPNPLAITIAESGKTFLIPADAQARTNPVTASPEMLAAAQEDYNARCLICHGEDGKGTTTLGTHMYPRAADLTAARTQGKSDGSLFWLVQNGLPHTGMPGWQGVLTDDQIWQVVTYVRQLPNGIPQVALPTPTSAPSASQGENVTVDITNSVYVQKDVTVTPGTTVVWVNHDEDEHTVTSSSEPRVLDSGIFEQNETFEFTFDEEGSYEYFCEVHDWMQGTVTVE